MPKLLVFFVAIMLMATACATNSNKNKNSSLSDNGSVSKGEIEQEKQRLIFSAKKKWNDLFAPDTLDDYWDWVNDLKRPNLSNCLMREKFHAINDFGNLEFKSMVGKTEVVIDWNDIGVPKEARFMIVKKLGITYLKTLLILVKSKKFPDCNSVLVDEWETFQEIVSVMENSEGLITPQDIETTSQQLREMMRQITVKEANSKEPRYEVIDAAINEYGFSPKDIESTHAEIEKILNESQSKG